MEEPANQLSYVQKEMKKRQSFEFYLENSISDESGYISLS